MRLIIYLFIGILFWSCNKPYIKKPDDLLSKSEMVDILVDLYTNQQLVNAIPSQNGNVKLDLARNSLYILQQHDTTHQTFEESYKYYFTDPKTFNSILENVKKELEKKLSDEEKNRLEEMNNENSETLQ